MPRSQAPSPAGPSALVIDTRPFDHWARARVPGSISIERRLRLDVVLRLLGLRARRIRLVVQSAEDAPSCRADLMAAGFGDAAGVDVRPSLAGIGVTGGVVLASALDLALRQASGQVQILIDVRPARDWARGHAVGAVSVPLDRRWRERPSTLPAGSLIWVYGADAARAATAASLLAQRGHHPVVVRDAITSDAWGVDWCRDPRCAGGVCRREAGTAWH